MSLLICSSSVKMWPIQFNAFSKRHADQGRLLKRQDNAGQAGFTPHEANLAQVFAGNGFAASGTTYRSHSVQGTSGIRFLMPPTPTPPRVVVRAFHRALCPSVTGALWKSAVQTASTAQTPTPLSCPWGLWPHPCDASPASPGGVRAPEHQTQSALQVCVPGWRAQQPPGFLHIFFWPKTWP